MVLRAVFFDLDGTLLDTSRDLALAVNSVRKNHGLTDLPYAQIRQQVSNGARSLIKLAFGEDCSETQLADLRQELLTFYLANIALHSCTFPGIDPLLQNLADHDIAWGIVTNKPGLYTEALMQQLHFPYPPVAVVCPETVGIAKPDPKPLLHACALAGCSADAAIYIGDHLRDIECGQNAGMPTIAVGYGFTENPDEYLSWSATHVAASAADIWPIIKTYVN